MSGHIVQTHLELIRTLRGLTRKFGSFDEEDGAGIASSGLSDSLSAAAKRAVVPAAPKASRIGSLVAETIVLVNPQRNYAQFLLRTLLPMVLHVIITLRQAMRWAPNSAAAACAPG